MAYHGTSKSRSNKQEKEVAEDLEGRIVIASGALDDKGDVRAGEFLVECKTTSNTYYPFRSETWNKVYDEAKKIGLCPMMCIEMQNRNRVIREQYAILRAADFDYYRTKNGAVDFPNFNVLVMKKQVRIYGRAHNERYKNIHSPEIKGGILAMIPWEDFLAIVKEEAK